MPRTVEVTPFQTVEPDGTAITPKRFVGLEAAAKREDATRVHRPQTPILMQHTSGPRNPPIIVQAT